MKLLRAIVGLLSLVGGIAIFVYISRLDTGVTFIINSYLFMGSILMWIWIVLSAISKLGMIEGARTSYPNGTALAAWAIFTVTLIAITYGTPNQPTPQLTPLENFLVPLVFFGWPIIDLFDAMLRPPNTD
ncbi:MAG TPA: hypothetical protein VMR19_01780 [Candidatus Saccharimonadales bacterium]|jgi:succinate-acetate transporter protein|nr:hypothetical protein [Candidatus Saccharimonadales bacterium]